MIISTSVFASSSMKNLIRESLQVFQNQESLEFPTDQNTNDWILEVFRVRLQVPIGIQVPELSKFELIPEVELIWQKN